FFFFSSRRRHTRLQGDWSSDVCSSDLHRVPGGSAGGGYAVGIDAIDRQACASGASGRGVPRAVGGIRTSRAFKAVVWGLATQRQIGRASCRERGEMLGVAEG